MNTDLELIRNYTNALVTAGIDASQISDGVLEVVRQARQKFQQAQEQGIPFENLQILPEDQRAAMQDVLNQMERSMAASNAPRGRPDFGTGTPPKPLATSMVPPMPIVELISMRPLSLKAKAPLPCRISLEISSMELRLLKALWMPMVFRKKWQ